MFFFVWQVIPVWAAVFVVVVTVLYFLFQGSGADKKKKKLLVTLQDPTVKYPLALIEKQVHIHTHRCIVDSGDIFI